MKIRLISHTTPVKALQDEGIETPMDLVAFCARVSNPSNQYNNETAQKLVSYLIRHKHWSPLQMVDATFEIECTRDIARQMLRHRSFEFQEFSGRYAEMEGYEHSDCRLQDHENRQNSIETDDEELNAWWTYAQEEVIDLCDDLYKQALDYGIAKEVARKLLPEGLVKSRLYMKGSLRSWLHYCELRGGNGTQKEHMIIAKGIASVISKLFPIGVTNE